MSMDFLILVRKIPNTLWWEILLQILLFETSIVIGQPWFLETSVVEYKGFGAKMGNKP